MSQKRGVLLAQQVYAGYIVYFTPYNLTPYKNAGDVELQQLSLLPLPPRAPADNPAAIGILDMIATAEPAAK